MIIQMIRRMVQALTLVILVGIPVLSLYAHYRAAGSIDDAQLMAGLRAEVATRAIHPYINAMDDPQGFLDGNKGTLWSMRLFGVDLTDPLAVVETLATSKHAHVPLLVSAVIPVILAILFGRVFCSWICPGYVLFELTGKLRRLLRLAEIQPGRVRFSHRNKYCVLLVGLIVAGITGKPLFALLYPPAVISRALHAWIFGTMFLGMFLFLSVLVAVELFVSPRWWCRTMCPGGALYGLMGWFRPVRIKLKRSACTGCRECIPVCEAGINPITQSESIECDNCGVCIRHCGHGALLYSVGLPGRRASSRSPGLRFAMLKTVVVAAALLSPLVATGSALGHHVLGLPHYSYKEHYPQRPTLEYPAQTGPYDVLLTSYPGVPVPGKPANLAFYIKNRLTNQVYDHPVTARVIQTSTFGDNVVVMDPTTRTPFDNEYKFYATMPTDGEYIVELSLPVEGRVEVIPFLLVVGKPTAAASFIVAGSFLAVMAFVVVRAIQVKRHRQATRISGERVHQDVAVFAA